MITVLMALVSVLALGFVAWPWLVKGRSMPEMTSEQQNKRLWRQQSEQLKQQREAGDIDQEAFDQLSLELDKRLLADISGLDTGEQTEAPRVFMFILLVLTITVGGWTYSLWGAQDGQALMTRYEAATAGESTDSAALLPLLADMHSHGKAKGYDGVEWLALAAKGYMEISHYRKAASSYDDLITFYPNDPTMLTNAAQAHYLSEERVFGDKAKQYVKQALLIDPKQPNALGFAGMASFETGDYAAAVTHWEALIATLPASEQQGSVIANALVEAKRRAGMANTQTPNPPISTQAPEAVTVFVNVGDGVTVPPGSMVFVTAKAVSGPPVPLAVKRSVVSQLPAQFTLTAADAMAPQFSLTAGKEIEVKAKISLSGNAISQSGDIESIAIRAKAGDTGLVELTIDQVVP